MTRKIRRTRNKSTRRGVRDRRTNRKVRVSNRKVKKTNRKQRRTNRKVRRTNRKQRRTNRKTSRNYRRSMAQIGGAVIAAKIDDTLKYLNEYEGDVTNVDHDNGVITIELKGDSIVKWESMGYEPGPITKPFSDFYKEDGQKVVKVDIDTKWTREKKKEKKIKAAEEKAREEDLESIVKSSDYLQQLSDGVKGTSGEVQSKADKIEELKKEFNLGKDLDSLDILLGKMWSKSCANSEQDDSLKIIIGAIEGEMKSSKDELKDLEKQLKSGTSDIFVIVSKIEVSKGLVEQYNENVAVLNNKLNDGVFDSYIKELNDLGLENVPTLDTIKGAVESLQEIEDFYEGAEVEKQEGPVKFKEYFERQNAEVIRRLEEEEKKLEQIVKLTRMRMDRDNEERIKEKKRLEKEAAEDEPAVATAAATTADEPEAATTAATTAEGAEEEVTLEKLEGSVTQSDREATTAQALKEVQREQEEGHAKAIRQAHILLRQIKEEVHIDRVAKKIVDNFKNLTPDLTEEEEGKLETLMQDQEFKKGIMELIRSNGYKQSDKSVKKNKRIDFIKSKIGELGGGAEVQDPSEETPQSEDDDLDEKLTGLKEMLEKIKGIEFNEKKELVEDYNTVIGVIEEMKEIE